MHNTNRPESRPFYRERLSPSLWLIVSAAVCAPMISLTLLRVDTTLALIGGVLAAVLIVAGMFLASPVVEVRDGWLRVGDARIETRYLADPIALFGDDARTARGPGLERSSWHLFRGGIAPVMHVRVTDEDDPVTVWVFSTRTPDRVVDVLMRDRQFSGDPAS